MLSTVFQAIGVVTVALAALLGIMLAMGWAVMVAGRDDEDGIAVSMFGFCWGFDNSDDEYL